MDSATIKAVGRYGRAIPRTHLPLAIAMRGKPDIVDLVGYDDVGCIPCYVGIEPAILIAVDINDADRLNPTVFVYTTVDDRRDVYAFKLKGVRWHHQWGDEGCEFNGHSTHCLRLVAGVTVPRHWPRIEKPNHGLDYSGFASIL